MKRLHYFAYGIPAVILGVIILAAATGQLPARSISWTYTSATSSVIGNIGSFFKNVVTPQDVTVIVFGKPGDAYNGGDLTDTLMVVHFNPSTHMVHLISIPRDLWVADVHNQQFKINEAYERNEVPLVEDRVQKMTGLSVNGYVVVDLALIKNIVDYLGGVDVVLSAPAVDWVSGYTMSAGPQHLSGDDAIWLIRNRYSPEGDFFREENQQQIVSDIFKKFKALSAEQKIDFVRTFVFSNGLLAHANLNITQLAPYVFETKLSAIALKNIVLNFDTKLVTTAQIPLQGPTSTIYESALIPSAGFEKYDAIKAYVQKEIGNSQ